MAQTLTHVAPKSSRAFRMLVPSAGVVVLNAQFVREFEAFLRSR